MMTPLIKHANKSFTLPDTCIKLRQVLDDPRASNDDIARVMSLDPSLSAKVLKLANSALFRFSSEVTNIPKALSVIGGEAAYNISIAETANLAFKSLNSKYIDFEQFWHKAVKSGLIARSIAQQLQLRGSERFFVMGILMHLSELVCVTKLEAKYQKYVLEDSELLSMERQRKVFGFTFSYCSGLILENWRLPESLYQPLINLSLYPNQQLNREESIIYLANNMVDLNLGKQILVEPQLNMQAVQAIGLEDYEYDIIAEFAEAEAGKLVQALS